MKFIAPSFEIDDTPYRLQIGFCVNFDYLVIGAGAAGVFSAIVAKESAPGLKVAILEKSAVALSKVRVSGGGRCNVTHNCFDVGQLVQNYPRGGKELIGPFHRFQPRDMLAWLEARGVKTKCEADGRIFPITDSSQTIIECLLGACKKLDIPLLFRQSVTTIEREGEGFVLTLERGEPIKCHSLLLATGSSPQGHVWARTLGHTIAAPVPSLFTFNVPHFSLADLSGVSVQEARLHLPNTSFSQTGPLLITHFGFSGPAAIKLSAWGARYLHENSYKTPLWVNWLPRLEHEALLAALIAAKEAMPTKKMANESLFYLPKNLWRHLVGHDKAFREVSHKELRQLCERLQKDIYQVEGKTTHKEEFVTCGGVTLKEIDFKTMQSRLCPHLYFAGEILDIDGVTGGFNFQNAWTTGYLAAQAVAKNFT